MCWYHEQTSCVRQILNVFANLRGNIDARARPTLTELAGSIVIECLQFPNKNININLLTTSVPINVSIWWEYWSLKGFNKNKKLAEMFCNYFHYRPFFKLFWKREGVGIAFPWKIVTSNFYNVTVALLFFTNTAIIIDELDKVYSWSVQSTTYFPRKLSKVFSIFIKPFMGVYYLTIELCSKSFLTSSTF